ncbi:Bacterial regulatory protein, gntR family [compost metagenome]
MGSLADGLGSFLGVEGVEHQRLHLHAEGDILGHPYAREGTWVANGITESRMADKKLETTVDRVYQGVYQAISNRSLRPGMKLGEASLAELFNVSRTSSRPPGSRPTTTR